MGRHSPAPTTPHPGPAAGPAPHSTMKLTSEGHPSRQPHSLHQDVKDQTSKATRRQRTMRGEENLHTLPRLRLREKDRQRPQEARRRGRKPRARTQQDALSTTEHVETQVENCARRTPSSELMAPTGSLFPKNVALSGFREDVDVGDSV